MKPKHFLLFAPICGFCGAIVSFTFMPLYIFAGLIHNHVFLASPPTPPVTMAHSGVWSLIQIGHGLFLQWIIMLLLQNKPWLSLLGWCLSLALALACAEPHCISGQATRNERAIKHSGGAFTFCNSLASLVCGATRVEEKQARTNRQRLNPTLHSTAYNRVLLLRIHISISMVVKQFNH